MNTEYRNMLARYREAREVLTSEIQASMADPRPALPHDQVMREIRQILTQSYLEKGKGGDLT